MSGSDEPSQLSPPAGDATETLRRFVSPASFSLPRLSVRSTWTEHAPFAFWLMEALRPRMFVELGAHHGFSYFVFCQAAEQLQLDTRCYAVDTWTGDEHAGFYGEEVFEQVRGHHERLYSPFSVLMRTTFNDAARHFIDGSIDLLHIDGRHRYEDVKADFETWRPRLSDRSVVLFHDTNVRRLDFGVYRFWDELSRDYPHFEFLHRAGLGVLGTGAQIAEPLRALFAAAESTVAQIRYFYARLGATVSAQFWAQHRAEELAKQTATIDALRKELDGFKRS